MTPKQRQTEKKADHEQEHVHMNRHNDLVAKNGEKGELLEKQGYGESTMLSNDWETCPNYPPPRGGVPACVCKKGREIFLPLDVPVFERMTK